MTDNSTTLDNPAWWSLATRLRHVAHVKGTAFMMGPNYGPFAALAGDAPEDIEDFLTLVADRQTPAFTMEHGNPFGEALLPTAMGVQMVADRIEPPTDGHRIQDLGEEDAFQILDLARRARPGPFECRTHQLGDFIGVKHEGRLIAMAGQRMRLPGYTEISAVCVDSAHRSNGLGGALVRHMAARIIAAGDQPFLHTNADNHGAIALYQRLGFCIRSSVRLVCWNAEKIAEARALAKVGPLRRTTEFAS